MAAELLDIEAKLDTSQVQGQLQQLSKTSGLQNLDRAIRTLENSMKKLSAAMEQQTHHVNTSSAGMTSMGNPSKLLGGRYLRGLGGYMIGGMLSDLGAASGNKTLQRTGGLLGSMTKGGAIGGLLGSAIPGVGNVSGLAIGAAIGGLDYAFKQLEAETKSLTEAMQKASKSFDTAKAQSSELRHNYINKEYLRDIKGMGAEQIGGHIALAEKQYQQARADEGRAIANLNRFEASNEYNKTLKYVVENKVSSSEFRAEAEMLQAQYDKLVRVAKNMSTATKEAEERLNALKSRQKELSREAEKAARETEQAAKAEQRLAEQRAKLQEGYMYTLRGVEHQRWLEQHSEGPETESELRGNIFVTQANLQKAQKQYEKTLKEAASSDAPEDFQSKLKDMATGIKELEDALALWKKRLEDKLDIQLNFNPFGALGNLNAVERAGYINANGQNAIPNLVEQILTFVRQITANTRPQNPTTTPFNS